MQIKKIKKIIEKLLAEIEEEDVSIGLFSIFGEDSEDLSFFQKKEQERIVEIFQTLSDDCRRHKQMLEAIVNRMEAKLHAG